MTAPITTFRLTRNIAAPQDRLWHLLTDARSREIWGAPSDDSVLVLETTDLREGATNATAAAPRTIPNSPSTPIGITSTPPHAPVSPKRSPQVGSGSACPL